MVKSDLMTFCDGTNLYLFVRVATALYQIHYVFIPPKDKINSLQIHFIVACNFSERNQVKNYVERAMRSCGLKSTMLSIIYMHKNNCITKENFVNDYQTNKELETREDLSVGEDLETLIKRIFNGEISREMIPERGELKGNFLICLLDKKDRLRLDSKDEEFLNTFWDDECEEVDIPLEEWNKSKSNLKFASSVSWRATYLIEISESEISLQESNRSPLKIFNLDEHSWPTLTKTTRSPQAWKYGRRIDLDTNLH